MNQGQSGHAQTEAKGTKNGYVVLWSQLGCRAGANCDLCLRQSGAKGVACDRARMRTLHRLIAGEHPEPGSLVELVG